MATRKDEGLCSGKVCRRAEGNGRNRVGLSRGRRVTENVFPESTCAPQVRVHGRDGLIILGTPPRRPAHTRNTRGRPYLCPSHGRVDRAAFARENVTNDTV